MTDHVAEAATAAPSASRVELVCTVTGLAKARGGMSSEAVCERFSLRIREALSIPVQRAEKVPTGKSKAWVRLDIRLLPLGRAEAAVTSQLRGKATKHPLLAVQVMDKALGLGEIDRLARLTGKTLAEH